MSKDCHVTLDCVV